MTKCCIHDLLDRVVENFVLVGSDADAETNFTTFCSLSCFFCFCCSHNDEVLVSRFSVRASANWRTRTEPREPKNEFYAMILVTTPAPTVLPPSRIAKRIPCSMATGVTSLTLRVTVSPGITISFPSGSMTSPVTSVVRT